MRARLSGVMSIAVSPSAAATAQARPPPHSGRATLAEPSRTQQLRTRSGPTRKGVFQTTDGAGAAVGGSYTHDRQPRRAMDVGVGVARAAAGAQGD